MNHDNGNYVSGPIEVEAKGDEPTYLSVAKGGNAKLASGGSVSVGRSSATIDLGDLSGEEAVMLTPFECNEDGDTGLKVNTNPISNSQPHIQQVDISGNDTPTSYISEVPVAEDPVGTVQNVSRSEIGSSVVKMIIEVEMVLFQLRMAII